MTNTVALWWASPRQSHHGDADVKTSKNVRPGCFTQTTPSHNNDRSSAWTQPAKPGCTGAESGWGSYLPACEAGLAQEVSTGLDPRVLLPLCTDLAQLKGGADVAVELVLFLLSVATVVVRHTFKQKTSLWRLMIRPSFGLAATHCCNFDFSFLGRFT